MRFKTILLLLLINGLAIAIIWSKDIFRNPEIDLFKGFFKARDKNC